MPSLPSAYRGPLIVMVLGLCFSVLGAIPVLCTISLGVKTSVTVIGVGFIGFGLMMIVPALFWCMCVYRTRSSCTWLRCSSLKKSGDGQESESLHASREQDSRPYQYPSKLETDSPATTEEERLVIEV